MYSPKFIFQRAQCTHPRRISFTRQSKRAFQFLLTGAFLIIGCSQPANGQQLNRTGDISFLYIFAEWPDKSLPQRSTMIARWQESENIAETYWNFHSLGKVTGFSGDFTSKFTFSEAAPTADNLGNYITLSQRMRAMAVSDGHNLDDYDHIVYSLPSYPDNRSFGALGSPGFVFFPGSTPVTAGFIHELGHAFGFSHANTFEGGSNILPGTHAEGRDGLFMMGSDGSVQAAAGVPLRRSTTNAPSKFVMRHLTEDNIHRVKFSGTTARIYDSEVASATPGQMMAAVIDVPSGFGQGEWWFSYVPKMTEHWSEFNAESWADGIVAHRLEGNRTHSIDFTPGSQGGTGNDKDYVDTRDGALRVGQSYTFPDSGSTVSPLAIGETDGNRWIDVTFTFPLQITSPSQLAVAVNETLHIPIEVNSSETLNYDAAPLPPGLEIDSGTGIISGTPTALGTYIIALSVSSGNASASQDFTLIVSENPGETLDTQGINWVRTGTFPWTNQTSVSYDSISAIETRAESSFGQSKISTIISGPVEVSFWWKIISSDSPNSLTALIDNVAQFTIVDARDWERKTIQIPEGEHELAWSFTGRPSDEGDDAAWLDQVQFNYGLDSDGDSLPDSWEIGYFKGLTEAADDDFDGDGHSNAEERIAGTNPIDPQSTFQIISGDYVSPRILELRWRGLTGRRYQIQSSSNLGSGWINEGEEITGTSGVFARRILLKGEASPQIFAPENSPTKVIVPGDKLSDLWKGGDEEAFAAIGGDSAWIPGSGGIGAPLASSDYEGLFGIDVSEIYGELFASSAFLRVPFSIDSPENLIELQLKMRYDSGFVAYINGVEVTRTNNLPAEPGFLSIAFDPRQTEESFVSFDITKHISALKSGQNILAIHGISPNVDSDQLPLLAVPELVGAVAEFDANEQEEKRKFWRVTVQD